MADQAALQEAIQRARQLAAKISQSKPTKRPLEDFSVDSIKVTHAYENNNKDNYPRRAAAATTGLNNNEQQSLSRGGANDQQPLLRGNNDLSQQSQSRGGDQQHLFRGAGGNDQASLPRIGAGYSSADERIEIIIPHSVIGLVIGKGGENIKRIQNETGATVRVDPNTVDEKGNKVCTITGTKQAVEDAHIQVSAVIENAASNKRPRTQVEGSEQYRMKIPASRTGAIIGKGGDTIKSIKLQSGCDIELDKGAKECSPDESIFIIRGTQDKIQKARAMIEARLASRGREGDRDGRSNQSSRGVATGANAAPVAQYTDLPTNYPAAGQQSSADMLAVWAAYNAQYASLFNQAGAQPSAAALPYSGQNLMGATGTQSVPQSDQQLQQSSQPQAQQQSQPPPSSAQPTPGGQSQQDYTDQWIEFYIMNGRPDYAEQVIEMKRQQQAQQKQQPSSTTQTQTPQ